MPIQPYKKVRTETDIIRLVQDAVELPLKDISNRAILDGQILSDIFLSTGVDNFVEHKLQRKLTGWIIIGKSANADVWEIESLRPQQSLVLQTSANVTVKLWVF